jgi:hypothetical protein
VIWKPDQVFEKSEKKGRFLEREIALFLYGAIDSEPIVRSQDRAMAGAQNTAVRWAQWSYSCSGSCAHRVSAIWRRYACIR